MSFHFVFNAIFTIWTVSLFEVYGGDKMREIGLYKLGKLLSRVWQKDYPTWRMTSPFVPAIVRIGELSVCYE